MLTERQAWLKLAKLWDKPKLFRLSVNHKPVMSIKINGQDESFGLCCSVTDLLHSGNIIASTCSRMFEKISRFRTEHPKSGYYFFPLTRLGAKKRAALCREFAKQCPVVKKKAKVKDE